MNSHDVAAAQTFYEALGFRLSDRTRIMAFMRIPAQPSGDHHSIALADADNDCMNHIAFVMPDLESVMRGGGRMKDAGFPIEWGPGRHGPGDNAFNYFIGPGRALSSNTPRMSSRLTIATSREDRRTGNGLRGASITGAFPAPPSARMKQAQREIRFADGSVLRDEGLSRMPEQGPAYDVAVVGFGPTGAVAAGLLGGLRTSPLSSSDRAREVYDKPRAIALDHEILRVFQQTGRRRQSPALHRALHRLLLLRRRRTIDPADVDGSRHRTRWASTPSVVFSQPPVEAILREHARSLPSVHVELGTQDDGSEPGSGRRYAALASG
jgi:catechol 2,3-dioxygenase-like lactoylglutathione lyase family enzyme